MSVKTSTIQMDFYLDDRRQISAVPRRGEDGIDFPAGAGAEVLHLNQMLRQRSNADLAKT